MMKSPSVRETAWMLQWTTDVANEAVLLSV